MLGEAAFLHSVPFELNGLLSWSIKRLPIIRLKNCTDAWMGSAEQRHEGNQRLVLCRGDSTLSSPKVQVMCGSNRFVCEAQRVHCSESDLGEDSSARGGG